MLRSEGSARRGLARLITGAVAAAAVALGFGVPGAFADPVPIPALSGVPALPGPVVAAGKPAANIGILKVDPSNGPGGTKTVISGSGLPANKTLNLTWGTATVTWLLDSRPDTVDYLGRATTQVTTQIGTVTTDDKGAFSFPYTVPLDFGATHDIYVTTQDTNSQLAHGGFLIERTFKITPTSGPIGTPIHVQMTGLGSTLYGSSEALYYDSHYTGVATALWTRGVADYYVRAAGPVGNHIITLAGGMQFNYLNYQQGPVPWAIGEVFNFDVTADNGPPKPSAEYPDRVTPTVDKRTTLVTANLAVDAKATLGLSVSEGKVGTPVTATMSGLTPNAKTDLLWSTVVGNRVNCTGTCWTFATVPLASGTADASGNLKLDLKAPDQLGGWHVMQAVQSQKIMAQTPFNLLRSIYSYPLRVKEGSKFTIHLKGVGWTQLDNAVATTYDNSYIGYGCGFNSNGDVVLNLVATGGKGTHLIDVYPMLYTYSPTYPFPPHNSVPFLMWNKDEPALALGYRLGSLHLAITVY